MKASVNRTEKLAYVQMIEGFDHNRLLADIFLSIDLKLASKASMLSKIVPTYLHTTDHISKYSASR